MECSNESRGRVSDGTVGLRVSLILDALNRSRQESESVPGIATEHSYSMTERPGIKRYLPWLAFSVALLVIIWLLVSRDSGPGQVALERGSPHTARQGAIEAPTQSATLSDNLGTALTSVHDELKARAAAAGAAGASAERAPGANNGSVPAEHSEQVQAGVAVSNTMIADAGESPQTPVDKQDSSAVEAIYKAQAQALYEQQATRSERGESVAAQTPPETASEGSAVAAVENSVEPQLREDPVDIERMLLQAREEMKDARLVDHSAPFLATLSQQSKDDIPTILYQRHDYSANESRSTVVLNGSSLQVGGQTRGVKVQEILPESVVLSFRGVVFRLRALNSWVNL